MKLLKLALILTMAIVTSVAKDEYQAPKLKLSLVKRSPVSPKNSKIQDHDNFRFEEKIYNARDIASKKEKNSRNPSSYSKDPDFKHWFFNKELNFTSPKD